MREMKCLSCSTGLLIQLLPVQMKGRVEGVHIRVLALAVFLGGSADLGLTPPTSAAGVPPGSCSSTYGGTNSGSVDSEMVFFGGGADHGSPVLP